MQLIGLLASGCGTAGAGSQHSASSDTPVSDGDRGTAPVTPAAGHGTAIIVVRDLSGDLLASIPVEVRTIGRPMPAALAIDIARLTDSQGEYAWTGLPPGEYEFTVRIPGGHQATSKRGIITAGQTVRVDVSLG
ncbi:carboxypeptidase-like regulatory domain-containing protein [Micromonospora sp. CPCC 206061]|uniref:carboxypeptidase-like regulatory domain-containing protein n=1 Tax=Micromonospora sp. CPCC 206061 TaxID=3122410 RepID=UPI003FA546BC